MYADRRDAGRQLAEALTDFRNEKDLLVLALPRGGVPVAREVATAFGAELDLLIVRKLGVPGHSELAMGAIATGGVEVLNDDLIHDLKIDADAIERVRKEERAELERREVIYRESRPPPRLAGRCIILVDDGLATGATMRAGTQAVRAAKPSRLVVAIPVAPPEAIEDLAAEADTVVCPLQPARFNAVGLWYTKFDQTSDDEVREILAHAWAREVTE